ncbi:Transposon Tf2-8 polyprotein [Vitis vinifera]|uniref:Transposon Tf2-8 polyprotein n=1 Tax=Vitis vinifera TaxID=29760 RepID=A0A438HDD9_VITVI|nr:Transposon Tf2-8 polyprotein [Vitis vinifera]
MPAELPKELPPRRPIDHKIELLPGTKTPAQAPYRMPLVELLKLRKQLKELLDAGLIQPSRAPYGAPVLFQKKRDGSLRMCVDYKALNKVTIKNKYSIPLATELFDRLSKVSYFTKLDLRSGYWQVRIAAGDEGKTTYVIVVYLDDIVVYSKTLIEHEKHLRLVFQRLRENRLYVKPEKYYYGMVSPYQSDGVVVLPRLGQLLQKCQMAFESLKEAISTELVLQLPDLDLPFEVQTDASDRALGGVLVQERHPVAFESRKLNNAEQRYSTHEKEMAAMVHYLQQWRHYLLGKYIYCDQASCRAGCGYGRLKEQVNEGVIRRPSREERTLALLARSYYWPKMGEDVQTYVKSCLVCQMDKTERKKVVGLLQPLPILERPWENISIDFITGFPKVRDFKSVFVVVDRFSKYVVFIPVPDACPAEEVARLFFSNVVKHFGLPKDIVSDRDARFTCRFWVELFKLLGSELKFSTANHPQIDGQTERINALLEEYLRHYVTATQNNWVDLMDTA